MERKRKSWTSKDDEVLKKCLTDSATLTEAFEKASKKLNRSAKGISNHYYRKHLLLIYSKETTNKSIGDKIKSFIKSLFI